MDIHISDDTLLMARQAKTDQGEHETEVSFNGECDLQRNYVMCDKNPEHASFIPVNDLTLDRLPSGISQQLILDFAKTKCKETVRLRCSFTSKVRPEGYTFFKFKGTNMMRVGSGRVWAVYKDTIRNDIPCPFDDCQEAIGPHMVYGFLRIHTAMHVVFDDEEARRTIVEFFYDFPTDKSTIVTARGVKVTKSDINGDFCIMECVTHNPGLSATLDTVRQQWMSIWPEVNARLSGHDVSMVVSHPHGCSKQISFGVCVKREWKELVDGQSYYRFAYTASTCPGCSGAPVWVPGGDGLTSGYATHSEYKGNGVGMSSFWFFWKPEQQRLEPKDHKEQSIPVLEITEVAQL